MTVKDFIDQLMNLPLDCELEIITTGPNPARPLGGDLAQRMYLDGWMLEHSSKAPHQRACVVLKTNDPSVSLASIANDYEDGTIELSHLKRTEDGPIKEPYKENSDIADLLKRF